MGRRSVNTTKSGKYMNPTDQARKIARKKELKKNKKQRNAVRLAVLKNKDPFLILDEMEKIDKIEYDPTQPPQLNERVLKEKRRKLKETYERVIKMYEREDPEYVLDLRKAENEYEKQREQRILYYEQVKNVEKVKLDNIPLPDAPSLQAIASLIPLPGDIPLPPPLKPVHSILKKHLHLDKLKSVSKGRPAGPPPGEPPSLSDDDEESEETVSKKRRIRFMEEVADVDIEKDSRTRYKMLAQHVTNDDQERLDDDDDDKDSSADEEAERQTSSIQLPPGPPPHLPPGPPPNFAHMLFRMPRLMPPRHMPPRMMAPAPGMMGVRPPASTVFSAPPTLLRPSTDISSRDSSSQSSGHQEGRAPGRMTIEAKPQIKNLIGDATRFLPVSLRVRREAKEVVPTKLAGTAKDAKSKSHPAAASQPSKDDAYDSFMREMQGLI